MDSRTAGTEPGHASAGREAAGLALGLVGVAVFSLTLPATRAAVAAFDPFFVAAGRALVAGLLALAVLAGTRAPLPRRCDWGPLAITALGVVYGFPFFSTWAMQYVHAAHGAVVLALLPLATALAGAWLSRERPGAGFWLVAAAGSATVVAFALRQGGGRLHAADLALGVAVASAAIGYATGAKLTARLGGVQTISWSLVASLPANAVLVALKLPAVFWGAPLSAWLGFAYVGVFSMYLGFFAWYRGLALGGTARVGQLQLLQPFLTFAAAGLLLGESIDAASIAFAAGVVALVALGSRMPVRQPPLLSASSPDRGR